MTGLLHVRERALPVFRRSQVMSIAKEYTIAYDVCCCSCLFADWVYNSDPNLPKLRNYGERGLPFPERATVLGCNFQDNGSPAGHGTYQLLQLRLLPIQNRPETRIETCGGEDSHQVRAMTGTSCPQSLRIMKLKPEAERAMKLPRLYHEAVHIDLPRTLQSLNLKSHAETRKPLRTAQTGLRFASKSSCR